MRWVDLTSDIEAMFSRLVVFLPESYRIDSPELPQDVVERVRWWKRRNARHVKAYDAARYQANRASRLAAARAYYAANRDAIRARRTA